MYKWILWFLSEYEDSSLTDEASALREMETLDGQILEALKERSTESNGEALFLTYFRNFYARRLRLREISVLKNAEELDLIVFIERVTENFTGTTLKKKPHLN
ncbi:MAG: hypothetical protein NUV81_03150 [bacterium]|nr:hypothetical protein [bacterium]